MPILQILLLSFVLIAALALTGTSAGWKKWLAWTGFLLLALPLLIAGVGGMLLSASGLAWRSCVKLPCGLAFVAGLLILLLRTAMFLSRRIEARWQAAGPLGSSIIVFVSALLCVAVSWYGLLFTAIWSGEDREVVVRGERMVAESIWMDQDYYAYHGPIIRGGHRIYGSWELNREDFGEAKE